MTSKYQLTVQMPQCDSTIETMFVEIEQARSRRRGCDEPKCPIGPKCLALLKEAKDSGFYCNSSLCHNGYVNCQGCCFGGWTETIHGRCFKCRAMTAAKIKSDLGT
jgi:hypothetical protein